MSFTRRRSSSTGLSYLSNNTNASERHIFFIPGLGCDGEDSLPLLEVLAKRNSEINYVAVAMPGHGESPTSLCPIPSFATFAKLVGELHDELGHSQEKTVLIGHSMGCRLALEIFSKFPDDFTAIILLDGNWHGTEPPAPLPNPMPSREMQLKYGKMILETTWGPHTPEAFKNTRRAMYDDADLDYLAKTVFENRTWDSKRMISALQQVNEVCKEKHRPKVLVIQGSKSSKDGTREMLQHGDETDFMKLVREHVGDAYDGLVLEESGHWPHVDHADEVAKAVLTLCS